MTYQLAEYQLSELWKLSYTLQLEIARRLWWVYAIFVVAAIVAMFIKNGRS